jgi:hypothetical protein
MYGHGLRGTSCRMRKAPITPYHQPRHLELDRIREEVFGELPQAVRGARCRIAEKA